MQNFPNIQSNIMNLPHLPIKYVTSHQGKKESNILQQKLYIDNKKPN